MLFLLPSLCRLVHIHMYMCNYWYPLLFICHMLLHINT